MVEYWNDCWKQYLFQVSHIKIQLLNYIFGYCENPLTSFILTTNINPNNTNQKVWGVDEGIMLMEHKD